MTRTSKLLFVPILLLQAGFFLYVSQHRLIDGDEGFYLLASRLVMQVIIVRPRRDSSLLALLMAKVGDTLFYECCAR